MADASPHRADLQKRAELRLAAVVAEHERRKWSIVAHVVEQLRTLGEQARDNREGGPES